MIDLHMHSNCSDDGDFSPAELVQKCKDAGISMMSITDHNTVRGNNEAKLAADELGIEYVTGIEIDCRFDGVDLHLLGYGINIESPDFKHLEKDNLVQEKAFSCERLKYVNNLGFKLTEADMNEISNLNDEYSMWNGEMFAEVLLGKPEYINHELLLPYRKGGTRGDNPYVNFYWDYFGQGKPCYTELVFPSLEDAIDMVKDNGGKAVLAHPGQSLKNHLDLFDKITMCGIDGVEVFCSYHNESDNKYFYERALKNQLFVTCGSDYHGKTKPAVLLGKTGCWLSDEEVKLQLFK